MNSLIANPLVTSSWSSVALQPVVTSAGIKGNIKFYLEKNPPFSMLAETEVLDGVSTLFPIKRGDFDFLVFPGESH